MKQLFAVALACLAVIVATPALAQDAAKPADKPAAIDVTGVWDVVAESPQGAVDVVCTFKQEGEKLTGTQASQMGEATLEGTVVGDEIKYAINFDMGGQQITITFAGKIEGDTIAGIFEFGGMGSASWTAKKRKQ